MTVNTAIPRSKLPAETMRRARLIFGKSDAIADNVAWPYGMSALNGTPEQQTRLVDWAWQHDLRADTTGCHCLTWLLREKNVNCYDVEQYPNCERAYFDHLVAFTRRGKPAVITNSPYHLWHADLARLGAMTTVTGVHVSVSDG